MKSNIKKIALIFIGIVTTILGLLWFLQGLDLVRIKPILCFANCELITGGSLIWAIIGFIILVIGIIVVYFNLRRINKDKTN
jgi:uncharacterized membrane protein